MKIKAVITIQGESHEIETENGGDLEVTGSFAPLIRSIHAEETDGHYFPSAWSRLAQTVKQWGEFGTMLTSRPEPAPATDENGNQIIY